MRRPLGLAAALGLHAALLASPALLAGGESTRPALLAALVLALGLQVVELRAGGGHDDEPASGSLDARLSGLTAVLLLTIQLVGMWERARSGASSSWLAQVGVALALLGVALRGAALRALGPDFVSSPDGRAGAPLRRSGVYGWVRHPSELGLLAFALGQALLLEARLALGLLALGLLPLVVWRTRREDRALGATFGPAHEAYRAGVGGLLPRFSAAAGG